MGGEGAPRTLWELIEWRAEETPDDLFAVDETERSTSFAEYRDLCLRAAAGLHGMGIGQGSAVSWQLPTWLEATVLVGALARLGAVQNPILPIYREREVGFATRQTGASLLIVPSEFRGFDFSAMAETVKAHTPGLEVLLCDKSLPEGDPATLPARRVSTDVRWVFYTSGTTADPKGARHTDETIYAAAHAMNTALQLTADDRGALVFPFTHIGGITWLFSGLITGASHVLVEAFIPEPTVELMRKYDCTLAGAGTPFHMAYLGIQRAAGAGQSILPKVRAYPGGGAPKPPQLHYDIKAEIGGVGIVSGYGLTEAPILSMASVDDPDQKLADTEGRASPGVELRVVDGEIRAKGPQLFKGYLDESLNADAFDEDGWFRTGDLGYLDDGGYVVITGRLKDVIIRKGENISAKEVEDLLYQHPKVADVAVIGLPDPSLGERCCAVVAPKEAGDPLTMEEMTSFLREKGLMVQKLPEQLELVDAVPRNPAGKILKHDLRDRYSKS